MCRILKSVDFDDFAQTVHIGGWPAIAYFIEQYIMHVFRAKGKFSYNTTVDGERSEVHMENQFEHKNPLQWSVGETITCLRQEATWFMRGRFLLLENTVGATAELE